MTCARKNTIINTVMLYYTFESIKYSPYTAIIKAPNTKKHKLQFWKITYSINGQSIVYLNDSRYVLKNTTLLFVKPQDVFQTRSYTDDAFTHRDIYISDERLREICRMLPYNPYEKLRSQNTCVDVSALQTANLEYLLNVFPLNSEEKTDVLDTLHQTVIINCLSMFISATHTAPKAPSWLTVLADRATQLEYLQSDIGHFLSDLPYTQRHVSRYFQKYYGTTPTAYLIKAKIVYSTNLLMDKELLIANIAQMLGFNTQSGFIKAFKEYFHLSPNAWRKKYLTDKDASPTSKSGAPDTIE